jgi:2,4-dienoyl-CoA reductase-like NADH-dependent reductase (Old Yellow Enzyme family)
MYTDRLKRLQHLETDVHSVNPPQDFLIVGTIASSKKRCGLGLFSGSKTLILAAACASSCRIHTGVPAYRLLYIRLAHINGENTLSRINILPINKAALIIGIQTGCSVLNTNPDSDPIKEPPMTSLFDPIRMGDLELANRIIMSPLTRCRAPGRVPNALMAEYYVQRATAGLIISEATAVTPMGVGYPDTPGIWSDEQVEGWKQVTDAVHQAGGKIVCQLWHVGRISHPSYLNGELPVSASAVKPAGHVSLIRPITEFVTPRALETDEIPAVIEAYRKGAENALKAGFDGVELHGANGYLPEQFLHSSTNLRSDQYGGSLENRARFMLEATDALISVWGASRVGIHLSPRGDAHDMGDANPAVTYGYLMQQFSQRGIAFVFTREHFNEPALTPELKKQFSGAFIANMMMSGEQAEQLVADGVVDAVAWGKAFISTPDLVARLQQKAAWNEWDMSTFYASGPVGYTDYPVPG